MAIVERYLLLVAVLTGLVFIVRYFFNKAERQITAKFVGRVVLSVVVAILITIPFFFLNNLSGL